MLTQENLKKILWYSPATGNFRWRVNTVNTKVGDTAGCLKPPYWCIGIGGKDYKRGRLAWLYTHGTWPTEVDHINLDKLDDRIGNLREVTRAQNQQNRAKHKNNKTGYKGVQLKGKRYQAALRSRHLGTFDTAQEAHLAYQTAACHIYGMYARF